MAMTNAAHAQKSSSMDWIVSDPAAAARLWRNVVYQAVWDVFLGKPRERRDACRWLGSQDFVTCCDQAAIEPGKMHKLLNTIWAMPQQEIRDFLQQLRRHLDSQP